MQVGGHLPEGVTTNVIGDRPMLATIRQQIVSRPGALRDLPFILDRQDWHEAKSELEDFLHARGWRVTEALNAPRPNFWFAGAPVVMRQQ
jgi:hypothetical protein